MKTDLLWHALKRAKEALDSTVDRVLAPDPRSLQDLNLEKWSEHFRRNATDRTEPDWDNLNKWMRPDLVKRLLPSLQQFELGDGGGPARLIAFNAERFKKRHPQLGAVIDAWFEEEKEHARLLAKAVDRFGGRHVKAHWSFSLFCRVRQLFGVRFELQVLLLTEIVSSAYYRVLKRHANDGPLKDMCSLINRDEAGHIAFHLDRLAAADQSVLGLRRKVWESQFWAMGYAAATVLWVNHGPCLIPLGAGTEEYYREVNEGISNFVTQLHRRAESSTTEALPRFN